MFFSNKLTELAYLCRCQEDLVSAILNLDKLEVTKDNPQAVYIDNDHVFILEKTLTRWLFVNACADNPKPVAWVKRGKGEFCKLMIKWLKLNGYE